MDRPMLTAILVSALAGILAGGGGVLLATKGDRANKHDAAMEQARASQVEAAARAGAEAVSEAMAPTLVQVEALSELARSVPPFCQESPAYSESACVAYYVCARSSLGAGEQAVGCDRALNTWESERQIAVIEADQADEERRRERRSDFGRRK
jgi:hypothetical protein